MLVLRGAAARADAAVVLLLLLLLDAGCWLLADGLLLILLQYRPADSGFGSLCVAGRRPQRAPPPPVPLPAASLVSATAAAAVCRVSP